MCGERGHPSPYLSALLRRFLCVAFLFLYSFLFNLVPSHAVVRAVVNHLGSLTVSKLLLCEETNLLVRWPSDATWTATRSQCPTRFPPDRLSDGIHGIQNPKHWLIFSCPQITSLDLSSFNSVATIQDCFLSCCSKITSLDLSGLSSVTTIGDCFLSSCPQINSLELSGLSSVVTIGDGFLSFCSQITSLDFSRLRSVVTIGDGFLSFCSQITALDFSGLGSVVTIGGSFFVCWLRAYPGKGVGTFQN